MPRFGLTILLCFALFAYGACGARDDLVGSVLLSDAGFPCPLGKSEHVPAYCVCDEENPCPNGYRCCQPAHVTADEWENICALPDDPVCYIAP